MDDLWIDEFLRSGVIPADIEETIADFIMQPDQVRQYGLNVTFYEGFLRYMRLPIEKITNDHIRYLKENLQHQSRFITTMRQMGWDKE